MLFFLEIPSITQNRVLIATGSDAGLKDAESRLVGLWEATQAVHNIFQMIEIGVLRSLALLKMARVDEALAVLDHVVTLATPGGWIRPFVEAGPSMVDLLKRLIKKNVAVEYIDRLLAAFRDEEYRVVPEASDAQAAPAPSLGPPSPRPSVSPSPPPQPLDEPLTNRELDALELLAQRLQNKEIAEKLCISPETVKAHLKKIFQKLMVSTRRQAITRAKSLGII